MEAVPSLTFIDRDVEPTPTTDKVVYLHVNPQNECIYLSGNQQRFNIRHVLKIHQKTLHVSKVLYPSPDCDHLLTFIGLLGFFEVHGVHYLAGISEALEFRLGWGKIYRVTGLRVLDVATLVEHENYAGLLNSYFAKGFYFSYHFDLTSANGISNQ